MPLEVGDRVDARRRVDVLLDAERAGTVVTDGDVLLQRLVEGGVVVVAFEFGNPLDSRAVEDDLDVVAVGLLELFGRFEGVRETRRGSERVKRVRTTDQRAGSLRPASDEVTVRFGAGENHDGYFRHVRVVGGAG